MKDYINCNKRPLIFVGCNYAMLIQKEVCDENGIEVAGIIDSDYFGNTSNLFDIPFIDTEESFNDLDKLKYYRDNFNFFCASNWSPENNPEQKRNREKRHRLINLLDYYQFNVISLVDLRANLSKYASVGRGVFIDAMCNIEASVNIHDYVTVMWACGIGHDTVIERNTVIQRQVWTGGHCHFEEDCFVGIGAKTLKTKARFGKGTWIQEMVYIKRGTVPGEIVGLDGTNTRRVVVPLSID
jgi:carbonic anhydrase/acetyltransferase-like protein (isoleucine patch superfamily)